MHHSSFSLLPIFQETAHIPSQIKMAVMVLNYINTSLSPCHCTFQCLHMLVLVWISWRICRLRDLNTRGFETEAIDWIWWQRVAHLRGWCLSDGRKTFRRLENGLNPPWKWKRVQSGLCGVLCTQCVVASMQWDILCIQGNTGVKGFLIQG